MSELRRRSLFAGRGETFLRAVSTQVELVAIAAAGTVLPPAQVSACRWVIMAGVVAESRDEAAAGTAGAAVLLHEGAIFGGPAAAAAGLRYVTATPHCELARVADETFHRAEREVGPPLCPHAGRRVVR